MRIILCDDHAADRDQLTAYLQHYGAKHGPLSVWTHADGRALLADPRAMEADLLLLDIYMRDIGGLDAARTLRSRGYTGSIILTTSSREHYAQGYEIEALHYLVKPIEYDALCQALDRARRRIGRTGRAVAIVSGRNRYAVAIHTIRYAEVYSHKTLLHTTAGILETRQSLTRLEQKLGGEPFLRCYRSYILNMDYVDRMEEESFLMRDGTRLPISRDGRAQIKARYMAYLFDGMGDA